MTEGESMASPSATTRTAATGSSGVASFRRKPLAPALSAENTYSSASKVVSMMTRGCSSPDESDDLASVSSAPNPSRTMA